MKQGYSKNGISILTYAFIVVLDAYINLVKYLQRVPLHISAN